MSLAVSFPDWFAGLAALLPVLGMALGARRLPDGEPDDEDLVLVRRARRGDREAFNELIRRYQGRIFAFCYRMIPDSEEAEEATQDVFVKVHANLARFRGESKFSTWLYQIAKNISLNKIKSLKRRRVHVHDSLDERHGPEGKAHFLEIEDERRNAHEQVEGRELRRLISDKIQGLREDHRLPLILRDIEGLRYDEIAKIMKLAEGTVKSRIHRARTELKESLDGHIE